MKYWWCLSPPGCSCLEAARLKSREAKKLLGAEEKGELNPFWQKFKSLKFTTTLQKGLIPAPFHMLHTQWPIAKALSVFLCFNFLLWRKAWQVNLFSSRIANPPVYSMKMSLYRDETGSLINLSGACLNVIMGFGYTSAILIYLGPMEKSRNKCQNCRSCVAALFLSLPNMLKQTFPVGGS